MVEAMEKDLVDTELGKRPIDWLPKPISEIVYDFRGGAPLAPSDFTELGFLVLPKSGVFRGGILFVEKEKQQYCSAEYAERHKSNLVDKDYTIVVLRDLVPSGPNIGLMVRIDSDDKYILAQGVYGFKVNHEKISSDFLIHISNTNEYRKVMRNIMVGSTQVHITNKTFLKVEIPLPPTKAEQTAIVTALYDANALITQLEKLIAKKRDIKQGAMQELLKPKEEWEVKKLGEIFKFLNTANNSRADLAESGEVEYIHYGDIHTRWNCFLDCSKNELPFIDKAKVISVPFLENGDLVIADASEDYEGLATCVEIKNIGKRKIVAGLHTLLLRGDKNIIADGFKGYLRNYHGVKDTLIRLSTGVSVFGISKTNLKEVEVSIPPTVEEQNHIVHILSDMDAEIESMEKNLEKYKMIKQGMMQNLLTGKIRLTTENKA